MITTTEESATPATGFEGAERYRPGDLEFTALGKERWAVRRRNSGSWRILPPHVARAVVGMKAFETLEEYANRSWSRLLNAQGKPAFTSPEELQACLRREAENGLLIRAGEIERRSHESSASPELAIGSLAISTADRPDQLEGTLSSFIENALAYGRTHEFAVFDASRDARNVERNRAIIEHAGSRGVVPIRYAGPAEKRSFARELADAAGVSLDLLDFAMAEPSVCGSSFGASGNAFLLDTVGELVLSMDDDVRCEIRVPRHAGEGIAFTSVHDPRTLRCYPTREQAATSLDSAQRDFAGISANLLGRSTADCLARWKPGYTATNGANPALLESIVSGSGHIVATMPGFFGGNGFDDAGRLLLLEGPSFEQLIASEHSYRNATQSREATRTVLSPTVSNSSFFTTRCFGLDNRELLPPFFPAYRDAEALMGHLLRRCRAESLSGYLPEVVLHAADNRDVCAEELMVYRGQTTAHAILMLIDHLPVPTFRKQPAQIMQYLGESLRDFAAMPSPEFLNVFRMMWLDQVSSQLRLLDRRRVMDRAMAGSGLRLWSADLGRFRESLRAALLDRAMLAPYDLRAHSSPEQALIMLQRIVRRFGELLYAWPAIIDAVRYLRTRGRRVSVALDRRSNLSGSRSSSR